MIVLTLIFVILKRHSRIFEFKETIGLSRRNHQNLQTSDRARKLFIHDKKRGMRSVVSKLSLFLEYRVLQNNTICTNTFRYLACKCSHEINYIHKVFLNWGRLILIEIRPQRKRMRGFLLPEAMVVENISF